MFLVPPQSSTKHCFSALVSVCLFIMSWKSAHRVMSGFPRLFISPDLLVLIPEFFNLTHRLN